ncbi:MAG TPA: DNA-directed RNA polymerase subunit alpha C-terminal domain-containing protein [Saprospiraceae bacterium]|nr:DNA-directed RNA polymerase subunit alpha C-terminal domain-containing protein [Saprospiraceae bacterium]
MSALSAKQYIYHRLSAFQLKEFIQKLDILTDRQKTILIRCDFDLAAFEDVGDEVNLSSAMVVHVVKRARLKVGFALMDYFRLLSTNESQRKEISLLQYKLEKAHLLLAEQGKPIPTAGQIDVMPVEDLNMSVRLYNTLKIHKINTVGQIKDVGNECLNWRNFSKKSYQELCELMDDMGITWPIDQPRRY